MDCKKNPTIRIGKPRTLNNDIAPINSPTVTLSFATRLPPINNNTTIPRLGKISRSGSKTARRRPTTKRRSRNSAEETRIRSISSSVRPSDLMIMIPSKLS